MKSRLTIKHVSLILLFNIFFGSLSVKAESYIEKCLSKGADETCRCKNGIFINPWFESCAMNDEISLEQKKKEEKLSKIYRRSEDVEEKSRCLAAGADSNCTCKDGSITNPWSSPCLRATASMSIKSLAAPILCSTSKNSTDCITGKRLQAEQEARGMYFNKDLLKRFCKTKNPLLNQAVDFIGKNYNCYHLEKEVEDPNSLLRRCLDKGGSYVKYPECNCVKVLSGGIKEFTRIDPFTTSCREIQDIEDSYTKKVDEIRNKYASCKNAGKNCAAAKDSAYQSKPSQKKSFRGAR